MGRKKKDDADVDVDVVDDRNEIIKAVMKQAQKSYGKGSVGFANDFLYKDDHRVSTGILSLDRSLGGGLPVGRISMIYGPKSCLAGDTFIGYQIRTPDGRQQDHKGGPIERLYERFNGIDAKGEGEGRRSETADSGFFIPSADDDGRVFINQVVDVVDSGVKECFRLTVSTGESISATADHRFYTGSGYARLGDLSVGDTVTVKRDDKHDADEQSLSNLPKEKKPGLGYAHEVEIVSIENVGSKHTYDIEMLAPYNNFVAEGLIVHNSSKTTTFLRAVGRGQRMCSRCWTPAFPIWTPDHGQDEPNCACGEYRKTVAAWLDVEGAWDQAWSKRFVNVDDLILARPDAGEQTADIADSLLRSSAVDIIVIDSIAFMTPLAEIDRSSGDKGMGEQARLVGTMMRKFVSGVNAISNQEGRRPTIWFTNQIRHKTGLVFGSPEVVPGGFAQGFATSTETRTAPKKYKMDEETGEPLSVEMKHRNEKNKTAPAKMEGEYTLILKDTEVKRMGGVKDESYGIKVGAQLGLVEVGRGWAEYKGVKYDGKSVLERHWMTNPEEYEAFKAEVLETLKVLRQ